MIRVAFTDVRADLAASAVDLPVTLRRIEAAYGVRVAAMSQVHGAEVAEVGTDETPTADALVTDRPATAVMVRVADCVPVLLADPARGIVAAAHAGRRGTELGVVTATVARMRELGAVDVVAWVGPHVCGGCYEVPEPLRAAVAGAVPATYAETRWGTPSLDLGAGVTSQLTDAGCEVVQVAGCTMEDPAWPSYRRDGAAAGRFAGLVWCTP